MERSHAPMCGVPGRSGQGRARDRRADTLPAAVLRLQARVGNAAVARMLLARTPSTDIDDADTNLTHLDNETFPGLVFDTNQAITDIENRITAYRNANHNHEPPYGSKLQQAATGLLTFTQNVMESSDGSWTEAGEMSRLIAKGVGFIPIPARSTTYDADIEYKKGHGAAAERIGIEAKAINSAATGTVTQQIQAAALQLGTRLLVTRGKITVWIAHGDNHWPGVHGFNGRTTDAQIEADIENQLDGMHIPNTDTIRIIMVRVPAAHPANAVTVKATGTNGNWDAQVIQHH